MSKRFVIFRPPFLIGLGTLVVQLLWWLGWTPGLASPVTADQFAQVQSGVFLNLQPAAHTFYLAVLSGAGSSPEMVTLFQIFWYSLLVAMTYVVLDWVAAPFRLAVCTFLALVPTVSVTLLTFSEDVPFSLLTFGVLLLMIEAQYHPQDFWQRQTRIVLVGVSIGGMAVIQHNGFLTVIFLAVLMLLAWGNYASRVVASLAIAAVLFVGIIFPVYTWLEVREGSTPIANFLLPDVARVHMDHADEFTPEQTAALERVAPLDVWEAEYDCDDATPLLTHEDFDTSVVAEAWSEYLELEIDLLSQFPETVAAHKLCASSYLYDIFESADIQYPRVVPQSNSSLALAPLYEEAQTLTEPVYVWMEQPSSFWVTWTPALGVMLGLAAALISIVRTKWRMPALLFLVHLGVVIATTPAHAFRYALPLYLMTPVLLALVLGSFRKSKGSVSIYSVESTLLGPQTDETEPDDVETEDDSEIAADE